MPCAFYAERPSPFETLDPGCQFKVQEDQLTQGADGATWCDHHLPLHELGKNITKKKVDWNNERIEQFNKAVIAWIAKAFDENEVCDLTGTVFPGAIDFSKIEIFPSVSFSNAQFSGVANFQEAQFSDVAGFRKAQFSGVAGFQEARFSGGANFQEARFSGEALFDNTKFSGEAGFDNARFSGVARFPKAQFSGVVRFKKAQFNAGTWFKKAQFSRSAGFEKAQFSGVTYFEAAQFSEIATFEYAQFHDYATFQEAQFSGVAWFDASGNTSTSEAVLGNVFRFVSFENVVFSRSVSFLNRQFLGITNFKGCVFHQAPAFHNCALHQDTNFDGTKFRDTKSEGAVRAYRTLKLAMENVRARQEEAMFYALEQQSLRARKDTPWSVRVASHLYHLTSNYGRSFFRPLGWLAGITLVAFGIFLVYVKLACISHCSGYYLEEVGIFTFEQLFRPFSVWTAEGGAALRLILGGNLSFVIMVLATFQSLISVSLVALFLLALRRRFKMG